MRLKDKSAIVTGAARGIGLAIATAYAREGASVLLADVDSSAVAAAADVLRMSGARVATTTADVSRAEAGEHLVRAATDAFGRLDLLVNNAGIAIRKPFLDFTLEEWQRVIAINLTGAFIVAQAATRHMAANGGGAVVNITSVSGERGNVGTAAYGAAKAGLAMVTKVMAIDLAEYGIRVNAVAPGAVETDLTKALHTPAQREQWKAIVPMQRYARPEEIADAAVFLASDEASYVTGHILAVDGGFTASKLMPDRR
ncbi:MAG: SDR family NAD(P)-dependent oxidoreductase [Alphaproteobacteria bacterium]